MSQSLSTHRTLAANGWQVSAIGLGCFGTSAFDNPEQLEDAESIRVIHRDLDAGGNFLGTAGMYGVGRYPAHAMKAVKR